MSRETEKGLKELQKSSDEYAEEAADEVGVDLFSAQSLVECIQKHAEQKTQSAETASDYLELARWAASRKKRAEYLHKALELEPDNLDARLQLIMRATDDQIEEQLLALQELLEAADKQMEKAGAFKEYASEFWTAPETRPYMRVRCTYFDVLIACGMMRRAIDEGQRLLELCENDNLGVRYQLMHLYAFMEDEMHALTLHKQYGANEETQMLLPLAVLYYKMNQLGKAEDYIKRLAKVNRNTKKFLRVAVRNELDEYIDEMGPYEYAPFTLEELLDAAMKARYLFDSVPYFFEWANRIVSTKTSTKKSAGTPRVQN